MEEGDLGFIYRELSSGDIQITRNGVIAATLLDAKAKQFKNKLLGLDLNAQQQLIARLTGNYKRGNERTAKNSPRNR